MDEWLALQEDNGFVTPNTLMNKVELKDRGWLFPDQDKRQRGLLKSEPIQCVGNLSYSNQEGKMREVFDRMETG